MPILKSSSRRAANKPASRRINASSFKQARAGARLRMSVKSNSAKGFNGVLDKLIFGLILLNVILTPIFITGIVTQGLGFEKMILFSTLTMIGVLLWIIKGFLSGSMKLNCTPLDWFLAIFMFFVFIASIFSVSVKDSIIGPYGSLSKGFGALLVYVLFYYLVVNNITKDRMKVLFWSLISSFGLLLFYALLQIFGIFLLPFNFTQLNSFNPVGSFSALTMLCGVLLPLIVIVISKTDTLLSSGSFLKAIVVRVGFGLFLLVDLLLLFILDGFAYWPLIIISMVAVIVLSFVRIISIEKKYLGLPVVILTCVVLMSSFNIYVDKHNQKMVEKYSNNTQELQKNVKNRLDFASVFNIDQLPAEVSLSRSASWQIAKESTFENPIIGSGPATYYYAFNKYKGTDFNQTNLWNIEFDNATSLYLELFSTLGVLGFLSFVLLTIFAVVSLVKKILKEEEASLKVILVGLTMSVIMIILYALLFGFNSILILLSVLISVLSCAYVYCTSDNDVEVSLLFNKSSKVSSKILAGVLVFVGIISFIVLVKGVKIYVADCYAKKSMASSDLEERVQLLEKAAKLAPFQDSYYVALSNYYVSLANQSASSGDKNKASAYLEKSIELGKMAVKLAPNKSSNHESLALLYENAFYYDQGALEYAEKSYQIVIELEPDSPTPYLRLGLINMTKARMESAVDEKKYYVNKAIKMYDESIKRKSNLASSHYGKSIAYETLGDLNIAIQSLTNATILNQNVGFIFELGRLYFNRGVLVPALVQGKDAVEDLVGKENGVNMELSVKQVQVAEGVMKKNSDLASAEQLFLSILLNNQNHANARYSLALLYNKVGDTEKASIMVKSLLKIIKDENQKEAIRKQFPGLY